MNKVKETKKAILKAKSLFNVEELSEDDNIYEERKERLKNIIEERLKSILEKKKERLKEAYDNFMILIQHNCKNSLLNKVEKSFINQLELFYKISISNLLVKTSATSPSVEVKISFDFSINDNVKYPDIEIYGNVSNLIISSDFDIMYNKLTTMFNKDFKKSEYTDDYVVIVKKM